MTESKKYARSDTSGLRSDLNSSLAFTVMILGLVLSACRVRSPVAHVGNFQVTVSFAPQLVPGTDSCGVVCCVAARGREEAHGKVGASMATLLSLGCPFEEHTPWKTRLD